MLVDTHVHLDDEKYIDDAADIVAGFAAAGLWRAVDVGCDRASSERALALAIAHEPLYATLGVHPHEAQHRTVADYRYFEGASKHPKVVAIGEIGLDYHYDFSPRDVQQRVFEEQLELASSLSLPVVIHSREATADTLRILKAHERELKKGGIIHCYMGSRESAEQYLELGFHIAFGGAITFKNAKKEDVVKAIPADRLLLETDCPYQTPVPYRGQRNEPKYVALVRDKMQEWVDFDVETVTTRNAAQLFGWEL